YIVAADVPSLIEFVSQVFQGEETFRAVGSAGGFHAEVRLGDSLLMIGGGGPGLSWRGEPCPAALHVYVEDTDAVYERALKAGGEAVQAPADRPYGERSGSVKDPSGNYWYIATWQGDTCTPPGMQTVTPCLHPKRAEPVIGFLRRSFGAEELEKHATPEGVILHAKVRIGDSLLEIGEAHGPYQPMPTKFYLTVPNVDASHLRALNAGAKSTAAPADQSYGHRTGSVMDVFGHEWYIATPIEGKE